MPRVAPRAAAPRLPIPPLIKRNIALFALSQSFTGAGMQFAYGLGPLMFLSLTGSMTLAGLSVAPIGLSRFLVAYPIGQITDRYGRKPGILLGLVLALCGALILFAAMSFRSPAGLILGMLAFGMGMTAAQQLRVAATDMLPLNRRAEALGYVALGSLAGLVISPLVIGGTEVTAHGSHHDPLALPWLLLPALILPGMAMVWFVRPDPKEIGMRLEAYFPGYVPPVRPAGAGRPFRACNLLRSPTSLLAIVSNSAAQGNMSVIMGADVPDAVPSWSLAWGDCLVTRVPYRRNVRLYHPAGAALVAFTDAFWTITLGTFLVGLGWAAANVAATALIADHSETEERGRAIGMSESCAGATSVVMALLTGPLAHAFGLPAAGWVAILVSVPPLLLALGIHTRVFTSLNR